MVYEPQEDSYLMEKYVKELAYGRVLDMGTGSGIQAGAAAGNSRVDSVLGVDIQKDAVAACKKKFKNPKLEFGQSDLFSNVKGSFDTIVFNPPYLPDDEKDRDVALDGGEQGCELIESFLKNAQKHLKPGGIILMVFSSRTGRERVEEIIKKQGFEFEMLEKQSLPFFEELYVFRLKKRTNEAELYARGKRGLIYKKGDVCIKKPNPQASVDTIKTEADFLRLLNKHNIGPGFISYEHNCLKREFVKGRFLQDFLESEAWRTKIADVLKRVLEQCRKLDRLGINKQELTNPYKDVIVTSTGRPVMIDFERCRFSEKPKNVTQFLQYIARNKALLKRKGLKIDKKQLIKLGKEYKKSMDDKGFAKIKKFISTA